VRLLHTALARRLWSEDYDERRSVAVSKHWKQAMQFLEIKMAAGWLGIRTALPVMPLLLL
jgi:hypothetical protein